MTDPDGDIINLAYRILPPSVEAAISTYEPSNRTSNSKDYDPYAKIIFF